MARLAAIMMFGIGLAGCQVIVGLEDLTFNGPDSGGGGEAGTPAPTNGGSDNGGSPPNTAGGGFGGGGGLGGDGGSTSTNAGGAGGGAPCEVPTNQLVAHYSANNVITNGAGQLASWPDQLNQNDLIPEGDVPVNPTVVTTSLPNGMPAVRFAGLTGSGLKGPLGNPTAAVMGGPENPQVTFLAVVRPLVTDADMTLGAYGEASGNYPRVWLATWGGFWHVDVTRGYENYCNNICLAPLNCDVDCAEQLGPLEYLVTGGAVSTEWSIIVGSKGVDTTTVSLDGAPPNAESQQSGLVEIGSQATEIYIGGLGNSAVFEGDIAEVFVYGRELPELEANDAAACLAANYGIQIGSAP